MTLRDRATIALKTLRASGVVAAVLVAVIGSGSFHSNQSAAFFQSLLTAPSNQIQTGTWQPPDAPLFWVEENNTQTKVSWQTSAGATSYRVYRSTDNVTFIPVQTVSLPALSYLDTGLTNQTNYYYKVTALNLGGNESPVAPIVAKQTRPEDIVIDDAAMTSDVGNSGIVTASPGWDLYQVGMGGYAASVLQNAVGGDNYSTGASATGQTYRWQPNSNLTGNYEVFVQYICDGSRGNAAYDIYANDIKMTGSPIIRSQAKLDGLTGPVCGSQDASSVSGPVWVHLADIAANDQEVAIQLTAAPGQAYILADAVAFRRTSDLTPAQVLAFAAPAAPGLTVTNSPTTPVEEHIHNGSFEDTSDATTTGWQTTGSVQNLAKTDADSVKAHLAAQLAPTDADHLVVIGADAAGQNTTSSVSQSFSAGVRNLGFDLKVLTTAAGKVDPTQKITVTINNHAVIVASAAELGSLSSCSLGDARFCSDWRHINLYLGDYTDQIQTLTVSVSNTDATTQTWLAMDDVTNTDLVVNSSAVFNLSQPAVPGITNWYQLGEGAQPTQGETFQLTTQPQGGWIKYWSKNAAGELSAIKQFTVRLVTGNAHDAASIDGTPFTPVVLPPVTETPTPTPTAPAPTPTPTTPADDTLQVTWHWQTGAHADATISNIASASTQLTYQLQYQHLVDQQPVMEMLEGSVRTNGATQVTLPDVVFGTCSSGSCVDHLGLDQIQLSIQTLNQQATPAAQLQQLTYPVANPTP